MKFTIQDVALNRLKLRPLLIFDRVLRTSSIGGAAKELHLTQPAVTKAIRELEEQLEIKLFERTNRGVVATESGVILGGRIKSVLAEMRYLIDDLNRFKGAEIGSIMVGTLISASAKLLPQAITALKAQSPQVLVSLRVGTINQLFPALARGELDMVVGRLSEADMTVARSFGLSHDVLYQERLCLVVGHKHPLSQSMAVQPHDLSEYPWIIPPPESPMRSIVNEYFYEHEMRLPSNLVESLSLMTNISLLLSGDWVWVMPRAAAQPFVDTGLLAMLPVGAVGEWVDVGVTIRDDQTFTPATTRFIACLKHVGMQMYEDTPTR